MHRERMDESNFEWWWRELFLLYDLRFTPVYFIRCRNFKLAEFFGHDSVRLNEVAAGFGVVVDDAYMYWPASHFEAGRDFLAWIVGENENKIISCIYSFRHKIKFTL